MHKQKCSNMKKGAALQATPFIFTGKYDRVYSETNNSDRVFHTEPALHHMAA